MRVKIELEIEIQGEATIEEVQEFFEFEFHYNGQCSGNNPMFDNDYNVDEFNIEELWITD